MSESASRWKEPISWLLRPMNIAFIVGVHCFVFLNYYLHRQYVLDILRSWENYNGIKSGTRFNISHYVTVQSALMSLIPLGILWLGMGAVPNIRAKEYSTVLSGTIRELLERLYPWLACASVWVLWLIALNAILYCWMGPDSQVGFSFWGDQYLEAFDYPLWWFIANVVYGLAVGFGWVFLLLLSKLERHRLRLCTWFILLIVGVMTCTIQLFYRIEWLLPGDNDAGGIDWILRINQRAWVWYMVLFVFLIPLLISRVAKELVEMRISRDIVEERA